MKNDLGLDYLSPTEPLGIAILIVGALFTSGIIYIFLNLDKESLSERRRKESIESERKKKLESLYPPK